MSVCVFQNLEKNRVLWTDFSISCREINWFSVSKIVFGFPFPFGFPFQKNFPTPRCDNI